MCVQCQEAGGEDEETGGGAPAQGGRKEEQGVMLLRYRVLLSDTTLFPTYLAFNEG
jgi:hypothetical protein